MREPTPEIIRDISARLSRPMHGERVPRGDSDPLRSAGRGDGSPFAGSEFDGQHFDIFAREHKAPSSSWIMCWSDLMMTMFIMFAAMYIFQAPKTPLKPVLDLPVQAIAMPLAAEASPPPSSAGSILDRVHDQLRDLIVRDGLEAVFSVRVVPEKSLHVILTGNLLFEEGGAVLRADVKKSLLTMADILRSAPQSLAVVGHSAPGEALRGYAGPWELSVARAADVAGFLMRDAGLPPERMLVVGYGDQRPVTGGDGIGLSRRVELVLSDENPMEPLPGVNVPAKDGFRQWIAASKQEGQ